MTGPSVGRPGAYGSRVSRSRWAAFLVYTLLRLAIFAAVWMLVQVITPWRGLAAIAVAILVSGGISLFVLDRPRGQLAVGVNAFMQRINDRIEASTRAEDVDPLSAGQADGGEEQGEPASVGQQDHARLLQDGDEAGTGGTAADEADGSDGRDQAKQAEHEPPVG